MLTKITLALAFALAVGFAAPASAAPKTCGYNAMQYDSSGTWSGPYCDWLAWGSADMGRWPAARWPSFLAASHRLARSAFVSACLRQQPVAPSTARPPKSTQ